MLIGLQNSESDIVLSFEYEYRKIKYEFNYTVTFIYFCVTNNGRKKSNIFLVGTGETVGLEFLSYGVLILHEKHTTYQIHDLGTLDLHYLSTLHLTEIVSVFPVIPKHCLYHIQLHFPLI